MDTTVSMSEIDEVSAAKKTRMKNSVPTNPPKGIDSNTRGRVMNMSPGPALILLGSPPLNATTAGIIIRPASKAIPVSKISIWRTLFSMLSSFFM